MQSDKYGENIFGTADGLSAAMRPGPASGEVRGQTDVNPEYNGYFSLSILPKCRLFYRDMHMQSPSVARK